MYLLLHHRGTLTWLMWGEAIKVLAYFVKTYEYVDFDFDVGARGHSPVGTGALGTLPN